MRISTLSSAEAPTGRTFFSWASLFAPEAFQVAEGLWRKTAPQRRGFNHYGSTEDPKIHDAVLASQKGVLDHLLNPVVLKRITDTELYGNEYVLSEMMGDLTDAIFAADARDDVNGFRPHGFRHPKTWFLDCGPLRLASQIGRRQIDMFT